MSNFDRGSLKEHTCEIILKISYIDLGGDVILMLFFIFSSGSHFVQRSRTILAICVAGHSRNVFEKLFKKPSFGLGGEWHLKVFLLLALAGSLFKQSETILAILAEGYSRNISMKSFLARLFEENVEVLS